MTSDSTDILARARAATRAALATSRTFSHLPEHEQIKLYREILEAKTRELSGRPQPAAALARTDRRDIPQRSSDLIDDNRHRNTNFDKVGDRAADFIEAVNFPQFVKDLLAGVFDANIKVMAEQTAHYIKLLKVATQSIAKFVKDIDDTAAFGYLAENDDGFSMGFDDEEKSEDGSAKPVLTDKEGNQVDLGDNEIKAKIMDAKIAMAREQRALLRETILMGVTRLVVEKGTIKAGVVFDVKASEQIDRSDKAGVKRANANSGGLTLGGPLGNIFGGISGGGTHSSKSSAISVSTTKSRSTTDLTAKLTGSVELVFKSDYFELNNFAAMYGQLGAAPAGQAPAGPGGPAGAAPGQPPSSGLPATGT